MELREYSLTLNTGEVIEVSEITDRIFFQLNSPEVQRICKPILEKCTHISRFEIEEAKRGFSKQLDEKLGTEPVGCLIKLALPCSEMKNCIISDRVKCNTKYINKVKRDVFYCPSCWEYEFDQTGLEFTTIAAVKILTSAIVDAWKNGRFVVIVDEEED